MSGPEGEPTAGIIQQCRVTIGKVKGITKTQTSQAHFCPLSLPIPNGVLLLEYIMRYLVIESAMASFVETDKDIDNIGIMHARRYL